MGEQGYACFPETLVFFYPISVPTLSLPRAPYVSWGLPHPPHPHASYLLKSKIAKVEVETEHENMIHVLRI